MDTHKLLCAFIYPACKSGRCLTSYNEKETRIRLQRLGNFIQNGTDLPIEHLEKVYGNMSSLGYSRNMTREYIYGGHLDQIRKRLEKETATTYKLALKNYLIANTALRCATQLYVVDDLVNDESISVRNLTNNIRKKLVSLSGLEKVEKGFFVSGHWEYLLEIINSDDPIIKKYSKQILNYNTEIVNIKRA